MSLRAPSTVCETEDPCSAAETGAWSSAWGDDGGAGQGPGFRWTVLRRHGKRPLAVLGRALLQANNRCAGLPYWSEISIIETAGRHFAASLCHSAPGAAGPTWCDSWLCDSPEAVRAICLAHDPLVAVPSHSFSPGTEPGGSSMFLSADAGLACLGEAALQRFRGAWAGLLAAIFGLHAATRPHP